MKRTGGAEKIGGEKEMGGEQGVHRKEEMGNEKKNGCYEEWTLQGSNLRPSPCKGDALDQLS